MSFSLLPCRPSTPLPSSPRLQGSRGRRPFGPTVPASSIGLLTAIFNGDSNKSTYPTPATPPSEPPNQPSDKHQPMAWHHSATVASQHSHSTHPFLMATDLISPFLKIHSLIPSSNWPSLKSAPIVSHGPASPTKASPKPIPKPQHLAIPNRQKFITSLGNTDIPMERPLIYRI